MGEGVLSIFGTEELASAEELAPAVLLLAAVGVEKPLNFLVQSFCLGCGWYPELKLTLMPN